MFHNWLAPTDHKKSNTDMMLLLSGEYRIRTDDPLTASQEKGFVYSLNISF
jgi:hypothetical protein